MDVQSKDKTEAAAGVGTEVNAELAAQDRRMLESLTWERLGRRPSRIESLLAGLGTRRFHRLHFEMGDPRTIVARIEDDQNTPRLDAATASSGTPALPTPLIYQN